MPLRDPFEGRAAKKREQELMRQRRERELSAGSAPPSAPLPAEDAARKRADPRFEGRRAKDEEARALKQRRQQEMQGAKTMEFRMYGLPAELRERFYQTRQWGGERSVSDKMADVFGDSPTPAKKPSRARAKKR